MKRRIKLNVCSGLRVLLSIYLLFTLIACFLLFRMALLIIETQTFHHSMLRLVFEDNNLDFHYWK